MGDSPFMLSTTISVIYLLLRFIEMRFIAKENKGMKNIIRDSVLVFLSVIIGGFIHDQLGAANKAISGQGDITVAFTDKPDF